MNIYKKLFGYFLIAFSLSMIVLIGLPQFYSSDNSGRLEKEVQIDVPFLKDEKSEIILVFFGYMGCDNICLPSLDNMSKIYNKIDKQKVNVYFVNLLDMWDKDKISFFATHFNKDFKGIHLQKDELKKVTNIFNVVYSKSFVDEYEINHSGHLYLLQKNHLDNNYTQKYIYTANPFAKEIIISDINNLLKDIK